MKWKSLPYEFSTLARDKGALAYLQNSLEELRSAIQEGQKQSARSMLALLLLVVLFELLNRSAATEFDLGPVTVNDVSLILKALPVVAAYTYFSLTSTLVSVHLQRGLHNEVLKKCHPGLYGSPIRTLLFPPSTFYIFNIADAFQEDAPNNGFGLITAWSALFMLLIILAIIVFPIVFHIYMAWQLFASFGFNDPVLWISISIMIIVLIQGFLNIGVWIQTDPDANVSL